MRSLRLVLLGALALCIYSGVLFGAHYYIATRLVLDPGIGAPWSAPLLVLLSALGATLILSPIAERTVGPPLARILVWPASVWMGFMFLILTLLGASDALAWLTGSAALAASDGTVSGGSAIGARAAAVATVALVVGGFALRAGLAPPVLNRVTVELAGWPRALDGYRIAQISDVHIGPILRRPFAESVVARVNALAPDLVAVTGDLVDGGVKQLADEVAPFADLRGRHGVYFVTGNHDHYSGADSWVAKIGELGIRVLRNERITLGDGDAVFDLVGVDDHRGDMVNAGGREDLAAALAGREPNRPAILLAHDPSTFKRASGMGIALQLSGHTHGGQIWPFHYLVRLVVPFVAGIHRRNGATLFVSRGTGFWGPPMRLFAPAEITELTLRAATSDEDAAPATMENA
jgi:predicted MPP superfamily phosphohydrolase